MITLSKIGVEDDKVLFDKITIQIKFEAD